MKGILNFIDNELFLTMLNMWISGFFCCAAVLSCEVFLIEASAALSISSFAIAYYLYGEEKKEE